MAEKFAASTATGVASGTNKTFLNWFNPAAAPTSRGLLYEFAISSVATPADQACKVYVARTTAVGTEGSGYTPINLDSAGPAGAYDTGIGTFTAEPTYTASKQLYIVSVNQRATFRWIAAPGSELVGPATQNAGIGVKSSSSTSTQAQECSILFSE